MLHQPVSHHDVADGEAACQPACDAGVDDRAGREPVDEHLRAARRADFADAAPDEHDLPRAQAARAKDQPLYGLLRGLRERRDERGELRIHGADHADPAISQEKRSFSAARPRRTAVFSSTLILLPASVKPPL